MKLFNLYNKFDPTFYLSPSNRRIFFWPDEFKSDSGFLGTGIAWKIHLKWLEKSIPLGDAKEVFDVELFGILETLKITEKEKEKRKEYFNTLTIFSNSQSVILRTYNDNLGPGQVLTKKVIEIVQNLTKKDVKIDIRWIPSHSGIKDNEKADFLTKKATKYSKNSRIDGYSSLSYINQLLKNLKSKNTRY